MNTKCLKYYINGKDLGGAFKMKTFETKYYLAISINAVANNTKHIVTKNRRRFSAVHFQDL